MNKDLLLALSALSGLAAALITQMMTGLFAHLNERRKRRNDLHDAYRAKKLDIGENYFFINGEMMDLVRKTISYWCNLRNEHDPATLSLMKKEMNRMENYQAKLFADNWRYNLVEIYFQIPFKSEHIRLANSRSRQLFIEVTDIANKIRLTEPGQSQILYQSYNVAILGLCAHYEELYIQIENNMTAVKKQLLAEFGSVTAG